MTRMRVDAALVFFREALLNHLRPELFRDPDATVAILAAERRVHYQPLEASSELNGSSLADKTGLSPI